MANQEQVARLLRGVAEWNTWRAEHPETTPDLVSANLEGARLQSANLMRANLERARLQSASFMKAILGRADLWGAILGSANLEGAELMGADLGGANLQKANLQKAYFYETIFANVNLTKTIGLDSCIHEGPSTIDYRTLQYGPLPVAFLRGCGLPDTLIDYLPSLLNEPLQFYSCFISYAGQDEDFAERLHADLQNNGVRCWFAPHDMRSGQKIHEQIDQAIRVYDKLLLVLSEASLNSDWVEFEIRRARKREVQDQRRVLFPVGLVKYAELERWECFDADTKKDLATEIREYFIPDFTHWKDHDAYQQAFDKLLRDLRDEAERRGVAPQA